MVGYDIKLTKGRGGKNVLCIDGWAHNEDIAEKYMQNISHDG